MFVCISAFLKLSLLFWVCKSIINRIFSGNSSFPGLPASNHFGNSQYMNVFSCNYMNHEIIFVQKVTCSILALVRCYHSVEIQAGKHETMPQLHCCKYGTKQLICYLLCVLANTEKKTEKYIQPDCRNCQGSSREN